MSVFLRVSFGFLVLVGGLIQGHSAYAGTGSYLVGPSFYKNIQASSFYPTSGNWSAENLFDGNTSTEWAINVTSGTGTLNPQGAAEGWVKFDLDQNYLISQFKYQNRGNYPFDSVNSISVWISESPFSVDVTNSASTTSFASRPATFQFNVSSAAEITSSLPTAVSGRYLVARFDRTPAVSGENLGGKTFHVFGEASPPTGEVPEPTSMAIFGLGALGYAYRNRRKRME